MGFNPRDYAGWTDEQKCSCGTQNYYTYLVEWITVKMMDGFMEGTWDVVRGVAAVFTGGLSTHFNGGLKDATHEAVQIYYRCRICGHEFRETNEIWPDGQKTHDVGHYNTLRDKRDTASIERSYSTVQRVFDRMWTNYNLVNRNCCHWSADFFRGVKG